MRILYSHRVQSHDGQSVHIEELISAFRGLGHNVVVVGPKFYEKAQFGGESKVIATIRRLLPRPLFELAELLYNVPAWLRLRALYKNFAPDFIYERYNLYYLAGVLLARVYSIPYYLEINSPLAEERSRFGGLSLVRLAVKLERFTWRSANRVFVVTAVLGDIVAKAGIPRDRITVIQNGVSRERFSAGAYQAASSTPITIGFVGFVREWHGIEQLFCAIAGETSDVPIQLKVVGPCSPVLADKVTQLGIANLVKFTGLIPHDMIPDVIRTFDIALQPSVVAYASPLKIFEYMACGRAIVAPDQPNIREILDHGDSALLFFPGNVEALWRAITELAARPELRERIGRAARKKLELCDYTWEGNATRIARIIKAQLRGAR